MHNKNIRISNGSAVILNYKGKLILQKRDRKKNIVYPGFWGLFGGASDKKERPNETAVREILEELNLHINKKKLKYVTKFTFDFSQFDKKQNKCERSYFYYNLSIKEKSNLVLNEGDDMRFFSKKKIISMSNIVHYDAIVLRMIILKTI